MIHRHLLLFSLSVLLLSSGTSIAQNQDSIKAYILELVQPDPNFSLTYSTGSISLEYTERDPIGPLTEEYIDEKKKEYESTGNPMDLYLIGQTYKRMNRRGESEEWIERALLEVEDLMGKYPDSIELVETASLIYFDNGQHDLACLATKMISDHYQNSKSLFTEAMAYMFTNQYDDGIAVSNKGMLLYPDEADWYFARMIHEFFKKTKLFRVDSEEFSAEENWIDRSFLEEGLSSYPDSLDIQLIHALGNFFLFAYDELIPRFSRQISEFEEVEGFKFDLGNSLEKKLEVHFEEVTKLSKRKAFKNWHSIHYTLGTMYILQGKYEKAIVHLEKAISLMKPKYRSSHDNVYHHYDNLIMCHRILGDVNSAEKCAKRRATEEINMDPVPAYYLEMALYRALDKDYVSSLEILDQTIGIDSLSVDAYSNKALILMYSGETDEALDFLSKAEAINPNDIPTFQAIILYYLMKKDLATAAELINRLEAYFPEDDFVKDARRLSKTE